MRGYTPGIWRQTVYPHGGSRIHVEDERDNRILIADTYQAADAALFLTAPDLLEALREMIAVYSAGARSPFRTRIAAKRQARLAIAKAEGKG